MATKHQNTWYRLPFAGRMKSSFQSNSISFQSSFGETNCALQMICIDSKAFHTRDLSVTIQLSVLCLHDIRVSWMSECTGVLNNCRQSWVAWGPMIADWILIHTWLAHLLFLSSHLCMRTCWDFCFCTMIITLAFSNWAACIWVMCVQCLTYFSADGTVKVKREYV